jgi:hypothetical protein
LKFSPCSSQCTSSTKLVSFAKLFASG